MTLYAFVLTVKYAKEYWVDIQSQRLEENVQNRASILLSNRKQSFFPLRNGFSNCLNGDLLPLIFR